MIPADFPEANAHFGPPPSLTEGQCANIVVYAGEINRGSLEGSPIVVTAWKPLPHELLMLNDGHPVFLTVIGGLPPHMLSTDFKTATSLA